ncbi:hypothetical protein TNCV_4524461, partial [Trichonephila clavipes]
PTSLNCRCSLIGYSPYITLAELFARPIISPPLLFSDLDQKPRSILALTLVRARRVMEHCEKIIMQDLGPTATDLTSATDRSAEREKELFQIRLGYIKNLLQVETNSPSPTPDTRIALEAELKTVEAKLKSLEGKMIEFLPRPIALSPQNNKPKAVKRPAAPVSKPAKSTKSKTLPTLITFSLRKQLKISL